MDKFKDGVPFDPGYSHYATYFPDSVADLLSDLEQTKSPHQKKFKLGLAERPLQSTIANAAGFYLGCLLWGAFIANRFKDSPKAIINNPMNDLTEAESKSRNYTNEIDFILEFIEKMDKDFRYFLHKPFKIQEKVIEILNVYKEFVALNNNFQNINSTSDVKLPEALEHFSSMDKQKLDKLQLLIYALIESGCIDKLLAVGFYRV